MANTGTLIAQAYAAFNRRDVDGALALMTENVSWPKASEGGRVIGKEEIRAYWTRQLKEFDPYVEPVEVIERGGGKAGVRVHQLVKNFRGDVLSGIEVWHVHTIADGRIERMDLKESEAGSDAAPSAAFATLSSFSRLTVVALICRENGWARKAGFSISLRFGRHDRVYLCEECSGALWIDFRAGE